MQLERLAADKAAQQLQLERDLQAARQEAQQVGRFGRDQCADVSISVLGTRRCGIVCTTQQHTPNQTARVRR